MYSRMAGTGFCSASTGSQMRAASRVPSLIGIQVCSIVRIWRGSSVSVRRSGSGSTFQTNGISPSVLLLSKRVTALATARSGLNAFPHEPRVGDGYSVYQFLGVGVLRVVEDLGRGAAFDDAPARHYCYTVSHT